MPTVTINPNTPPNQGESPGLGASQFRALKQAILDLFNLPSNAAIAAPLSLTRVGPLTNRTGVQLVAGDVVGLDRLNDTSVVLADTVSVARPLLVALATIINNDPGVFGQTGQATVRVFGAVTRGNYLRKSATTLSLEDAGASSGPLSGVVGIALTAAAGPGTGTVTALLLGAPSEPSVIDVASYGVSPSGLAGANRSALQAAVDAIPTAGGTLRFREYGIHIDAAINVAKPLKIEGPGTTQVATPGTFVLYLDTAGQNGFTVTGLGPFVMRDFSVRATATTPYIVSLTGGAGTPPGLESARIENCVFYDGQIQVDVVAATHFTVCRCLFVAYKAEAIRVRDTLDGDQGDSEITGNTFRASATTGYGVIHNSGGGLRIVSNKFLGGTAAILVDPLSTPTDPATISDLIIAENSIELFSADGILLTRSAGALLPSQIHIVNNQIQAAGGGGGFGIRIEPANVGTAYGQVVIEGNLIARTQVAIRLREVTGAVIAGNLYNLLTLNSVLYDVASTVTNLRIGFNHDLDFVSVMAGTPGANAILKGGAYSVAQLPPMSTGSTCFALDALGPGDGGYTGYGMTATAGGGGAPAFRRGGVWKV